MIVEGQTEETFVRSVLLEHLAQKGVWAAVRCVETSRDKRRHRIYRGGMLDYQRARRDILRWMKEDQNEDAFFTTMFDLYALPSDFPRFAGGGRLTDPAARVRELEAGFKDDINHPRFIPYIQLHEFEALLLADPPKFDWEFIEHEQAISRLVELAGSVETPEHIDDGPETAPSKRIIKEIPEYEHRKASAGPVIASKIGLDVLRARCPHFHSWVQALESLT
jgi:hypothetical protein